MARNKLLRKIIENNKWMRRLKALDFINKDGSPKQGAYCWKKQGKPCSCYMCDRNAEEKKKYRIENKHKKNYLNDSDIGYNDVDNGQE